jgi:hypothetical protein
MSATCDDDVVKNGQRYSSLNLYDTLPILMNYLKSSMLKSLTSNHLPLTAMSWNFASVFEYFHVRKLSSWL